MEQITFELILNTAALPEHIKESLTWTRTIYLPRVPLKNWILSFDEGERKQLDIVVKSIQWNIDEENRDGSYDVKCKLHFQNNPRVAAYAYEILTSPDSK